MFPFKLLSQNVTRITANMHIT